MTFLPDPPFERLQFYTTATYPCNYLAGRQARSQVVAPSHLVVSRTYADLIQLGFRRSGLLTHRPHCNDCQACIPMRIPVLGFKPDRSQKRAWQRHQALQTRVLGLDFVPEHYELYRRYQRQRHSGGGMDHDNADQYTQFLLQSQVNTQLVEFRAPCENSRLGALKMVAIMDVLDGAMSAVYTFFEPQDSSGLGTYSILWQIEQARRLQLNHVYLGYWLRESRKMNYKSRFGPAEFWYAGRWLPGGQQGPG